MRLRDAILQLFENNIPHDLDRHRQGVTRCTRTYAHRADSAWIPFTGGIRVTSKHSLILVEVDGRGGIFHLVTCWHFLARIAGGNTPRVTLFYIYIAPSSSSGDTLRGLWDFLSKKVKNEFGAWFQGHFGTCVRPAGLDCHAGIPGKVIANCRDQLEGQGILVRFRRSLLKDKLETTIRDNVPLAEPINQGWREP